MIRTVIQPTEIFDRPALTKALDLTATTLAREVRLGRLKSYRRAGKSYFVGQDVLDWLRTAGDVPEDDDGERKE